jgi:adenylate cyclase
VIPLEKLQFRLEDSLETGAKHYVPEQTLKLGIWQASQDRGYAHACGNFDLCCP